MGSGITCGSILTHPVQQLDVVEISKEVIEASRFFKDHNHAFYQDPRVRIYEEDAKTFLELTQTLYDVIVSEPSNPWMSGIGGLFSKEYFQNVKQHLAEGGIFVQWFHGYEMTDETVEMVLRTFSSVFPQVSVWNSQTLDILLLGTMKPITIDWNTLEKKTSDPAIMQELGRIEVTDIPSLLVHEMISTLQFRKFITPGLVNSDYFPYLEYQAPKDFFCGGRAMNFFERDERHKNTETGHLLLSNYMKTNPLSRENLMHIYQVTDFRHIIYSLTALWDEHFPNEAFPINAFEEKNEARFELAGLKAAISFYQELMEKNPENLDYLRAYLSSYFVYYSKTRSIFYAADMTNWFRQCDRALRGVNSEKEKFFEMKSEVLYREGNLTESIRVLEEGIFYLRGKNLPPSEKNFALESSFMKTIITRCLEEGRKKEAFETLRKLLVLDPKNQSLSRLIRYLQTEAH